MKNINALYQIRDGYIEIRCPIEIRKGNGKNVVLATTRGVDTFKHDGKEISINLNVWVDRSDYEK